MNTATASFKTVELERIDEADDLKISPLRNDGVTYGTPTWIWEVVVDSNLYVRAYNGISSRWYCAAIEQKAGRIKAAGMTREVNFETVEDVIINEQVNEAYKKKYSKSPYVAHMTGSRATAATVKITPRNL